VHPPADRGHQANGREADGERGKNPQQPGTEPRPSNPSIEHGRHRLDRLDHLLGSQRPNRRSNRFGHLGIAPAVGFNDQIEEVEAVLRAGCRLRCWI
jgi:hypothetical protein